MNATEKLDFLIQDKNLDTELKEIAQKVLDGIRLTVDEGLVVYERGELGYLSVLANYILEKKNCDYTYFYRNFHIEPTHVCVYECKVCAYCRPIQEREQG